MTVTIAQQAATGLMIETFPTCRPLKKARYEKTPRKPRARTVTIEVIERNGNLKKARNMKKKRITPVI